MIFFPVNSSQDCALFGIDSDYVISAIIKSFVAVNRLVIGAASGKNRQ